MRISSPSRFVRKWAALPVCSVIVVTGAAVFGDQLNARPLSDRALREISGLSPTLADGIVQKCGDVNVIDGTKGATGCLNPGEACTQCPDCDDFSGNNSYAVTSGGGQAPFMMPCNGSREQGTCYIWGYTNDGNNAIFKCAGDVGNVQGTCGGNVPYTTDQPPFP